MVFFSFEGFILFFFQFFLHPLVLNLQLLGCMAYRMLPAELSLNRGRVLDISVYNHIKCYYSNRFGVGAVQLSLCLPKRTEARFKLFGCVNSHSFLEINAMPNFARSESDPPCLLTRHQSNLPHDSV